MYEPEQSGGTTGRAISREIVAIYKEYLGRGPTEARTVIADDLVVCVLGDSLTKAERSMVERGDGAVVRNFRRYFQDTMEEAAIAAVERLTDRKATAMLSDHRTDPDVAVEVFPLEPLDHS